MKLVGSMLYVLVSMGINEIAQSGRARVFQSRRLAF